MTKIKILSEKEKRNLLENSRMYEFLNYKQIMRIMWWSYFNKKRINKFYNELQIGKAVRFAYQDTLHY